MTSPHYLRVAIIIANCLFVSLAYAQDIKLRPFEKNETRKLSCKRIKNTYWNDTLQATSIIEFNVILKVINMSTSHTKMEWTYLRTKSDHQKFKPVPEKYMMGELLADLGHNLYTSSPLKIVYEIDSLGVFKNVLNAEEIRTHIQKAVNHEIHQKKADQKMLVVYQQFLPALLSDDYISSRFIEEVRLYHHLAGTDLNLEREVYEIELPNPLSGEPIPGTLTTEGTKQKNDSYVYTMHQEIDNDKASEIVVKKIEDTYEKMGETGRSNPPVFFECLYRYTIMGQRITEAHETKKIESYGTRGTEEIIIR